jgi:NAD(P)-dependent dehydrogenase (short-subunit alcohol dehydrogenase family)
MDSASNASSNWISLTGRVCVATDAASGLGAATARALIMTRVLPGVARDVLRLVTHEVGYADFETALSLVERREGGKIVPRP